MISYLEIKQDVAMNRDLIVVTIVEMELEQEVATTVDLELEWGVAMIVDLELEREGWVGGQMKEMK